MNLAPTAAQVAIMGALELMSYDLLGRPETPATNYKLAVVCTAWGLEGMGASYLGMGPVAHDEWLDRRHRALYRRHRAPLRRRAEGLLHGLYTLHELGVIDYATCSRVRNELWQRRRDVPAA